MADGTRTEFTLLLYLTGSAQGLVGGETTFYGVQGGEMLRVVPVAGSALLHRHGTACLLHEAIPVQKGAKWVLCSDIIFA